MITVYVMATCPDCVQVKARLKDSPNHRLVDIGEHVRNLKAFLRLRDSHPAFESIRAKGSVGIPCFVTEDGSVSFSDDAADAANVFPTNDAAPDAVADGAACNL
ncbi:MAG: hypothetical protein ACI3YC_02065, partial [Alloprevotella sp.]